MRSLLLALVPVVVVVAGCAPNIPDGRFACTTDSDCPPMTHCASGRCHAGTLDAGPLADGGGHDGGGVDTGTMTDSGGVDTGTRIDSGSIDDGGLDAFVDVDACGSMMCGGECVDFTSDVLHCGGCSPCDGSAPHVTSVRCVTSACVNTCESGWTDCTSAPGCESDLSTSATCGSCGTHCGGAEFCDPATHTCMATCAFVMCGSTCIDIRSNVDNCNGCGLSCPQPAHSTRTCIGSTCGFACDPGYTSDGVRCNAIPPPRAVRPLTDRIANQGRPNFRFVLPVGTARGLVQICADEACTTIVQSFSGTSPVSSAILAEGLYYWRVAGTMDGVTPSTSFTPVWRLVVGSSVPYVGNTLGPTYFDVTGPYDTAVGSPTEATVIYYPGTASGIGALGGSSIALANQEGYGLAAAGDVDGDGFGDLIVGACGGNFATMPTAASCGGNAYVFRGQSDGSVAFDASAVTLSGPAGFGYSVSSAGDYDGDGYGDVIVGAYWANEAFVFFGSAAGTTLSSPTVLVGPGGSVTGAAGGFFGTSVAGLGDIDADGFDDVAVGAPGTDTARVFYGRGDRSVAVDSDITGTVGSHLGLSVCGVGDFTGDGYSDLAVGGDGGLGVAEIHSGGPVGIAGAAYVSWTGTAGSQFGTSVIGPGDLDHDGYADLAVGAPGVQTVFVYMGDPAPSATATATDARPGTRGFGYALGRTGPLGASLLPGIVVGSCGPTAATCTPHAYVLTFNAGLLTQQADLMQPGDTTFGTGVVR